MAASSGVFPGTCTATGRKGPHSRGYRHQEAGGGYHYQARERSDLVHGDPRHRSVRVLYGSRRSKAIPYHTSEWVVRTMQHNHRLLCDVLQSNIKSQSEGRGRKTTEQFENI
eukprot:5501881-Amphidinium_carterae.1